MILRKQERRILEYLLQKKTWVNAKELSSFLNISVRTLGTRIKELNQLSHVIDSSHKGYRIADVCTAEKWCESSLSEKGIDSVKERRNFLIKKLMLAQREIDFFELEEQLCVSDSTLQSDLMAIRKQLSAYRMGLEVNEDRICIVGDHENYQKLMSDLIYQETDGGILNFDVLQEAFPTYDISILRNLIIDELAKERISVDDYSLISILLHFCILLDNAKQKRSREAVAPMKDAITKAAVRIITKTKAIYPMAENIEAENLCAVLALYSRRRRKEKEDDQSICRFVSYIGELLYKKYHVNIRNEIFVSGMVYHLESLLQNQTRELKNPLYETIRNDSPIIYEMAVIVAREISEKWKQLNLNEHEISYIAIHIGLSFERKEQKVKIAIINLDYHGSNKIIMDKLIRIFKNKIESLHVYSDESEIIAEEADLVISTMKMTRHFKNSVTISLFMNEEDEQMIREAIDHCICQKEEIKGISMFSMFDEALFTYFDSKDLKAKDLIQKLCAPLIAQGIEHSDFEQRVVRREEASTTSYQNIAVPHSFESESSVSKISVGVLKYPVKWGVNLVNIVFLLSISKQDQRYFVYILDKLLHIFTSEKWKHEHKKVVNYRAFMDFLKREGRNV